MIAINQQTLTLYKRKLDKLLSDLHLERLDPQKKYTPKELSEINQLINNLTRFRALTQAHSNQAVAALSLLLKKNDKNATEQAQAIINELTQEAFKLKESITELQKTLALKKENEFLFSMIVGISTAILAPILFISVALLMGPLAYLPLNIAMALLAPAPIPLAIPFTCVMVPFFLSYLITSMVLGEPWDPAAEKLLVQQKRELNSRVETLQLIKSTSIDAVSRNIASSIHGFFNSNEAEKPSGTQPLAYEVSLTMN